MNRSERLQKLILRRLLFYGRTTRPELVALTGRRAATVFEAIDALKAASLVIEPERRGKKTGRRAPELECNRKCASFLGIELRSNGMTGVVTDSCGDTLEQYEARFASPLRNAEAARGEIGRCIAELRQLLGDKWQLMRGVGFAAPAEGETRDIVDRLADECGVPAGAWPAQTVKTGMEYIARLPNAPESLFHLHVGDGIGGGFIKEGKIFTGSSGGGIGIGHIVVDRDGPPCSCGGRGCLEAVAGRAGILEMVRAELRRGADTELREDNFSIRRFAECSHRDETARKIAVKAAESIGLALAAVATLLDPAVIVLSGELTGVGDPLLETVRGTLERNCPTGAVRKMKLELSTLEPGDTARGAAMMIRDRIWGIDEWPYGENLKTDTIK